MDKTFSPSYSSSQITFMEAGGVEFLRFLWGKVWGNPYRLMVLVQLITHLHTGFQGVIPCFNES